VVYVALSLVVQIIYRVVVLQGTGVLEGIRLGWQLVRQNFMNVFLMWLIVVGIQLGFFILMVPVVLVLGLVGLLVGGGGGFGLYFLVRAFSEPTLAAIIGGIIGGGLFLLLFGLPLLFLDGLKETYLSTVWTLTYRALVTPAAVKPVPGDVEANPALPA
jgi:hypothetical protein